MMRCDKCRFFHIYVEDDIDGECRRHAPRVWQENTYARWPTTNIDDWCGEFEKKAKGKA
jgi:hypothetical protein